MALPRPVRIAVVPLLALAIAVAGCGDDEGAGTDTAGPAAGAAAGDVQRYCELSTALDAQGEAFFRELEQRGGSPAEFREAEERFVREHEQQLDELVQVAPEEISEEARTLVAGLRATAGLGPAVDEAELAEADRAVNEFEERACPQASP